MEEVGKLLNHMIENRKSINAKPMKKLGERTLRREKNKMAEKSS